MDDMNAIYERLSKYETIIDSHEKRLYDLEEDNEILIKLSVLVEQQNDIQKDQKEQHQRLVQTLQNVNENLVNMNSELTGMKNRVGGLEQAQKDQTINFGQLFKQIVWYAVPSLVLAYLLMKFGLK